MTCWPRFDFWFFKSTVDVIVLNCLFKIDHIVFHSVFMELVLDVINQFMSVWEVREVLLNVLKSMLILEKLAYSTILLI